ncbi:MAG: hypothetical protein J6Q61_01015 [Bacteroidales bacterium]|nr:hypothetical protein [Bacteroidales bacterium]
MGLIENVKVAMLGFKPDEIKTFAAAGVSTNEIIELSKNGYSAKDISDLIDISKDNGGLQPGNDGNDNPSDASQGKNDGEKDDSNYDKELKDKETEIEKLKSDIEKLQKSNAQQNLGGSNEASNREKVQNIFRNLY